MSNSVLDRIVISFPSLASDGKMRFDFSGKEESVRLKKNLLSSKQFNNSTEGNWFTSCGLLPST